MSRATRPYDFRRRLEALKARGLHRDVADDIWWIGDAALLADLERATGDQLREVNAAHAAQRASLSSALAKVGDLPCVGAVLYAQAVSS